MRRNRWGHRECHEQFKERRAAYFEHWEKQFWVIDDGGRRVPSGRYPLGTSYRTTKGEKFRIIKPSDKRKKKAAPKKSSPKTREDPTDVLRKARESMR